jgi:KilA-N domain
MVAVTDLWKAAGSPAPLRPDKWFKSDFIQEKLGRLASILESGIERDDKGKIVGVPGSLEIVRGGRYNQGTFISYDLAIEYSELVSEKFNKWFISVLPESASAMSNAPNPSAVLTFPIGTDDFPGEVRITPDGRVSVYDGIGYLLGNKNPYQVWNDLTERIPVFLQKTEEYKFPGKGGSARLTPVATLEVFT